MNIENIYDTWGSIIYLDSPEEFFTVNKDYWRNLIYNRKLLIFKKVNFTKAQYAEFSFHFGSPWKIEDYRYSKEWAEIITTKYGNQIISPFSNELIKKIPPEFMPWHADIPNRQFKPFPFRSLWITSNPNPDNSGQTIWMNLEESFKYLSDEMKELIPKVTVVQQSWYEPGKDIQEFPLLKVHPITNRKSLRLNHYNWGLDKSAWIIDVKIDNISQKNCTLIKEYLDYLEGIKKLKYQHRWDLYDIALYDNYSFVHARTALNFDETVDVRHFYRINIDHLDDKEWHNHKTQYFNL
jgi:alpha-ketoglutarate-dependent taurine dioxygenase